MSCACILVVLVLAAASKFLIAKVHPEILGLPTVKSCFQLSIFLFVPLFLILIFTKYKYNVFMQNPLRVQHLSAPACWVILVLLTVIALALFIYLLMSW